MITKTLIAQTLEKYRDFFDRSVDDGMLTDRFKIIADAILQSPVITTSAILTFGHVAESSTGATQVYQVRTTEPPSILLGFINWSSPMHGYGFSAQPDIVCDADALETIGLFLRTLMHLKQTGKPLPKTRHVEKNSFVDDEISSEDQNHKLDTWKK